MSSKEKTHRKPRKTINFHQNNFHMGGLALSGFVSNVATSRRLPADQKSSSRLRRNNSMVSNSSSKS
jgi:hypothetical protein